MQILISLLMIGLPVWVYVEFLHKLESLRKYTDLTSFRFVLLVLGLAALAAIGVLGLIQLGLGNLFINL